VLRHNAQKANSEYPIPFWDSITSHTYGVQQPIDTYIRFSSGNGPTSSPEAKVYQQIGLPALIGIVVAVLALNNPLPCKVGNTSRLVDIPSVTCSNRTSLAPEEVAISTRTLYGFMDF